MANANNECLSLKRDFNQFLADQQRSQSRWSALGSDFWPRFVVHTRSSIWARYPRLHLISLDWIYVEWLKRLLDKRFGKVCTLVSDVHHLLGSSASELATLRAQPQLRETFARLCGPEMDVCAPWWLSSCIQVHTEICIALFKALSESPPLMLYTMPAVWRQPRFWPFEAFLRSRWGDKLPGLLDCDVKELRWWREPQPTPVKPPQEPEEKLVQPWLRPYCVEEGEGGPLWSEGGFRSQLWKLLDSAMAPVWDRKFYRCEVEKLTTNFTQYEDLRVCSWINNWLGTFGLPFMDMVQKLVDESTSDESVCSRMAEYVTAIETLRSLPSAPREADCETHADFMLEPTLLLQLPLHPALLQQWLAAALLEVTRFEYYSMELRHWPLPASLAELATYLLSLVCCCKEHLLVGVALLCRDVVLCRGATTSPTLQSDTPQLLLDEVILPAVQVLSFLVSREADSLLSEIKQQAWSSSSEMSASMRSVPAAAYTAHDKLVQLTSSHFFHPRYWLEIHPAQPYSVMEGLDLTAVLEDLQNRDPNIETQSFFIKNWNLEEQLCMAAGEQNGGLDSSGLTQHSTATSSAGPSVEHGLARQEDVAPPELCTGENALPRDKHEEELEKYTRLEQLMPECQPPTSTGSVLGCLVRLSALSMARQQAVRRQAVTAQVTGRTPTLSSSGHHGLPPLPSPDSTTLSTDQWLDRLATKLYEVDTADRDWFEEQFPYSWTVDTFAEKVDNIDEVFQLAVFKEHCAEFNELMGHFLYESHMQMIDQCADRDSHFSVASIYSLQSLLSMFLYCEYRTGGYVSNNCFSPFVRHFMRNLLAVYQFKLCPEKLDHPDKEWEKIKDVVGGVQETEDPAAPATLAAFVASSQLRHDDLLSTFRVLASPLKVLDAAEPYLASLVDWASCFPEPSHEMHKLVISAVESKFLREWNHIDSLCHEIMAFRLPRPGAEKSVFTQLYDLSQFQRTIMPLVNVALTASLTPPHEPSSRSTTEILLALQAVLELKFTQIAGLLFHNWTISHVVSPSYVVPAMYAIPKSFVLDTREQFLMSLELLHKMRFSLSYHTLSAAIDVNMESRKLYKVLVKHFFFKAENPYEMARACSLQVRPTEHTRSFKKLLHDLLGNKVPASALQQKDAQKRVKKQSGSKVKPPQQQTTAVVPPPPQPPDQTSPSSSIGSIPAESKECLRCKRHSKSGESFLPCEWCVSRVPTFPEPAHFCSAVCQAEATLEHEEEHLEFELGLGRWFTP